MINHVLKRDARFCGCERIADRWPFAMGTAAD
jgi:hypothetical protein